MFLRGVHAASFERRGPLRCGESRMAGAGAEQPEHKIAAPVLFKFSAPLVGSFHGPVTASPVLKDQLAVILGQPVCTNAPVCPQFSRKLNVKTTMKALHGCAIGITPSLRPRFNTRERFSRFGLSGWYIFRPSLAQSSDPTFRREIAHRLH